MSPWGVTSTRTGSIKISPERRADFTRHGGRKQQRLALFGQERGDLANIAHEAHVEHPVGLVEDEEFDRIEPEQPLVHEIEQAAGRGDENVDAARQGIELWLLADAAHDHGLAQMQILAIGAELVVDLDREFAGRRKDQGARTAPPVGPAVSGKLVEKSAARRPPSCRCRSGAMPSMSRPARRSGMARAWIGVGDDVVSVNQRTLDRLGKAEFREFTNGHLNILMRRVARTMFSSRLQPGVSPLPRARPEREVS